MTISIQDISNHYIDAQDRIWLLDLGKPVFESQDSWNQIVIRNIKFLKDILLDINYTQEQLEPIQSALAKYAITYKEQYDQS